MEETKHTQSQQSERVFDLEERLLIFAAAVVDVSDRLPKTVAGNHLAAQLLRAGTSPFASHGETQSADSQQLSMHKARICLKELREARRWARLVERQKWLPNDESLAGLLRQSEELIRVFNARVQTAERKLRGGRKRFSPPAGGSTNG